VLRSRAVSLALVGLFVWVTGCTKWVPMEPPYPEWLDAYGKLRITNERGVPVVFKEAHLEGDSVRGTVVTSYWERGDLKHIEAATAIPLDSVRMIEKRGTDVAATVAVILIPSLIIGIAAAASASTAFDN